MAFFSAKNAGLAFMILAVVEAIVAVLMIVLSFMDIEDLKKYSTAYFIIVAVGALIAACLYFTFGKKVRDGEVSNKIDILAQYVKIVGIVTIVGGICGAIAEAVGLDDVSFGAALGGAIISIILGLIIMFIASKINDGKQTTGDKIIWIILLVLFVLLIIAAVGEIITIIGAPVGICDLIIYVFMLTLLVDPEVKSEMNM
ncbi:MAG: hypothetical protein IKN41_02380 [Candidatus Methanomethylophilaceae archaeon]|nr:hypothetical protein [Candidatus Methanomethylophilaceae archaeon]